MNVYSVKKKKNQTVRTVHSLSVKIRLIFKGESIFSIGEEEEEKQKEKKDRVFF